jgi:hypothetical protein
MMTLTEKRQLIADTLKAGGASLGFIESVLVACTNDHYTDKMLESLGVAQSPAASCSPGTE